MSKSKEERGRIAVDIMTKNFKTSAEQSGRTMSDNEARKKATEIAERADRKRQK